MKVLLVMWSSDAPRAEVLRDFTAELYSSGELVAMVPLAEDGRRPFIAACWLIDCVSMERAVELAARIPCDAVEVRPVMRAPGEEM